jgi:2-polyprenyl-6-methoxyphenol hydroxylase-like FAD-dependent oxidoreductase
VAARLGLRKERTLSGEISFLFGYWRGVPDNEYATLDIAEDAILSSWAGEDGVHLLVAAGDADFTRGSKEDRRRRYVECLRRFPRTIDPAVLERAEMASEVIAVPESLMRGFYRTPTGPGWALVGDACHFKHPGSAQGIADAIEQAIYLAEALCDGDPCLDGYRQWRDERTLEHYSWSFSWGRFPAPESEPLFRGWSSEPDASQDLRDAFSRQVRPLQVMSKERLQRWFASR